MSPEELKLALSRIEELSQTRGPEFRSALQKELAPFEPTSEGQTVSLRDSAYYRVGTDAIAQDARLAVPTANLEQARSTIIDSGFYRVPDLLPFIKNLPIARASGEAKGEHGTHVTGVFAKVMGSALTGTFPFLTLLEYEKSGGSNKFGEYETTLYSRIREAMTSHGARVINLSLKSGETGAWVKAIVELYGRSNPDTVIVVSAANDAIAMSKRLDPLNALPIVYVSALNPVGGPATFSNMGQAVWLSAPGVDVLSYGRDFRRSVWMSGTSQAAPLVSGATALIRALHPSLPTSEVKAVLKATAIDLGLPGHDPEYGWGQVNAYRAAHAARALQSGGTLEASLREVSLLGAAHVDQGVRLLTKSADLLAEIPEVVRSLRAGWLLTMDSSTEEILELIFRKTGFLDESLYLKLRRFGQVRDPRTALDAYDAAVAHPDSHTTTRLQSAIDSIGQVVVSLAASGTDQAARALDAAYAHALMVHLANERIPVGERFHFKHTARSVHQEHFSAIASPQTRLEFLAARYQALNDQKAIHPVERSFLFSMERQLLAFGALSPSTVFDMCIGLATKYPVAGYESLFYTCFSEVHWGDEENFLERRENWLHMLASRPDLQPQVPWLPALLDRYPEVSATLDLVKPAGRREIQWPNLSQHPREAQVREWVKQVDSLRWDLQDLLAHPLPSDQSSEWIDGELMSRIRGSDEIFSALVQRSGVTSLKSLLKNPSQMFIANVLVTAVRQTRSKEGISLLKDAAISVLKEGLGNADVLLTALDDLDSEWLAGEAADLLRSVGRKPQLADGKLHSVLRWLVNDDGHVQGRGNELKPLVFDWLRSGKIPGELWVKLSGRVSGPLAELALSDIGLEHVTFHSLVAHEGLLVFAKGIDVLGFENKIGPQEIDWLWAALRKARPSFGSATTDFDRELAWVQEFFCHALWSQALALGARRGTLIWNDVSASMWLNWASTVTERSESWSLNLTRLAAGFRSLPPKRQLELVGQIVATLAAKPGLGFEAKRPKNPHIVKMPQLRPNAKPHFMIRAAPVRLSPRVPPLPHPLMEAKDSGYLDHNWSHGFIDNQWVILGFWRGGLDASLFWPGVEFTTPIEFFWALVPDGRDSLMTLVDSDLKALGAPLKKGYVLAGLLRMWHLLAPSGEAWGEDLARIDGVLGEVLSSKDDHTRAAALWFLLKELGGSSNHEAIRELAADIFKKAEDTSVLYSFFILISPDGGVPTSLLKVLAEAFDERHHDPSQYSEMKRGLLEEYREVLAQRISDLEAQASRDK